MEITSTEIQRSRRPNKVALGAGCLLAAAGCAWCRTTSSYPGAVFVQSSAEKDAKATESTWDATIIKKFKEIGDIKKDVVDSLLDTEVQMDSDHGTTYFEARLDDCREFVEDVADELKEKKDTYRNFIKVLGDYKPEDLKKQYGTRGVRCTKQIVEFIEAFKMDADGAIFKNVFDTKMTEALSKVFDDKLTKDSKKLKKMLSAIVIPFVDTYAEFRADEFVAECKDHMADIKKKCIEDKETSKNDDKSKACLAEMEKITKTASPAKFDGIEIPDTLKLSFNHSEDSEEKEVGKCVKLLKDAYSNLKDTDSDAAKACKKVIDAIHAITAEVEEGSLNAAVLIVAIILGMMAIGGGIACFMNKRRRR